MTEVRTKAIEVFYSYAHKDERLRNELDKHLFNLKMNTRDMLYHKFES